MSFPGSSGAVRRFAFSVWWGLCKARSVSVASDIRGWVGLCEAHFLKSGNSGSSASVWEMAEQPRRLGSSVPSCSCLPGPYGRASASHIEVHLDRTAALLQTPHSTIPGLGASRLSSSTSLDLQGSSSHLLFQEASLDTPWCCLTWSALCSVLPLHCLCPVCTAPPQLSWLSSWTRMVSCLPLTVSLLKPALGSFHQVEPICRFLLPVSF